MTIHDDVQILRSKLIAMTRLTQRTVDYSIKAFQLGRPELCRTVQTSKEEMGAIRGWIADHGRAILAARTSADPDSRFACAALRISSALEIAYDAAYNIARHSALRFTAGWTPVSSELEDAGNFVNNLLRLCILSLLKRDAQHAKAVLQDGIAGQSFDLAVYLAHDDLAQRISAHARFELALVRCLDGIAGQVREIADALVQWHDEIEQREGAPDGPLTRKVGMVPAARPALACNALRFVGAMPAPRAANSNPPDDFGLPSWKAAHAVQGEDFTQTRLLGLQQRVCELLVKNEQLRMALMAERADSYREQLC